MDVMQFQVLTTKSSEMFFVYSIINNIQINSYVPPLLGLAKTIYNIASRAAQSNSVYVSVLKIR